uniref:TOG domain-containing protein n=1 Tax=Tetraodon nigroviridis TaxID=99883 RepID=H3DJB5_TETNG
GLIPLGLYEQLLDLKSYQNRIAGVEELKRFLTEVDMRAVPPGSIEKFVNLLPRLLDDINFKVLCGTLQVLNLLIQKLGPNVESYFKQLVSVGLKTLGDARNVVRSENMNVFQQLMKAVAPQQILDLITGSLQNKNSRVREDVLNIIMAAMLAHPKRQFDVHKLCFEVAPCLADSKRRVRHAALELFAIFDYCLDTGKKQPLMKAVDMVELNEDADGLMAAVQTRRSRRLLPRLSSEGTLEYGLVCPNPENGAVHHDSGADLDWVMNGGRISSAKSNRTEPDCTRLHGYGSLGSLTSDLPLQRRIVSAGKGKNKLPWEMSIFSAAGDDQRCGLGRCSEQVKTFSFARGPTVAAGKLHVCHHVNVPLCHLWTPATSARLRRSGSLNLDPDNFQGTNYTHKEFHAFKILCSFKTTTCTDTESGNHQLQMICSSNEHLKCPFGTCNHSAKTRVTPKGHTHSRNLTVTPRSFLLPSYPLSTLPGKNLTPTLPRRQADSAPSMSNTWPNKKENSLPQPDPAGPTKGTPGTTAQVSDALPSLSVPPCNRTSLSVSPVVPKAEQGQSCSGQRSAAPGSPDSNLLDHLALDPDDGIGMMPDPQDEDPPDIQEVNRLISSSHMHNSLRSVRNSAAKKKAKLRNNSSDPDSPDSAVKLDLGLDTTSHASPVSESGLSSLSSVLNDNFNGIKTSPRSSPSGTKGHISRVPSAKLRTSLSADFSIFQRSKPQQQKLSSHGFTTNKVASKVLTRCPTLPGVFSTTAPSAPGEDLPPEPCAAGTDPRTYRDKHDSPQLEEVKQWVKCGRFDQDRRGPCDRQELPSGQGDHTRDKNHHHIRTMPSESTTEGMSESIQKGKELSFGVTDEKKDLSQPGEFFQDPYLALAETFSCLHSDDWEKKMEGMRLLRRLALYHSDTLQGKLPEVCLCLIQEVNNLRSVVSSFAVDTLGYLYSHLQKGMDQELEATVKVLLQKAGQTNNFIRQAVDAALNCMVQHCTATRSIGALLSVGVRYFGRQMLLSLSSNSNFDKILEKHISGQDLLTIKNVFIHLNKEGNKMPQDTQSARGKRVVPVRGVGNKTEYSEQLTSLLASNDFRDRIRGIEQLVADCQHNPNMVISTIFPVFDAFKDRLLESNSKVNLHALESLPKIISVLKNDMSRVVNILFPAIVDSHLNSKNNAIYSAAVGAINALILHLDRQILVQPFCTKAQFLKGKAKVDLIEKVAELVTEVYPCKPQIVEHKVLPLLWHLLSTSTHKGSAPCRSGSLSSATTKLCQALHAQMGPSLTDLSASQSAAVHLLLNDIL